MVTTKVTGLDLSMTATGITWSGPLSTWTETIRPKSKGDLRLHEIAGHVGELARGCELVLIEGYLNTSHSAGITGMVHGAVRRELIAQGIPYATMAPSSLKKYATGKGNAGKPEMAVALFKRAGLELADDNQVDSRWLWEAALDFLGVGQLTLPKAQRDALLKIKREV